MQITPELWVVIVGQAVGICVSVGVYLKTMTVIEKKIDDLERDKLDCNVHVSDVRRLDGDIDGIDGRVTRLETRRHG